MFKENYYNSVRICLPIPIDKSKYELYGYNKDFNKKFLKLYSANLLATLKTKLVNLEN